MNSRLRFIFLFIISFSGAPVAVMSQVDTFATPRVMMEKMFVHTDKSFYVAGETIWYTMYNLDAASHKPIDLSKVAYVELIDEDKKPVLQVRCRLQQGIGSGSLALPFTFNTGNYIFRAYTNWMKNFGSQRFFEKQITVINTVAGSQQTVTNTNTRYDVQLFPEGGSLVLDLSSVIGCKVTDSYGKGKDFTAAVINKKQDTLLRFTSLKFGMGRFKFTPGQSDEYAVVVRLTDTTMVVPFPVVQQRGFVIHAERQSGNLALDIKTSFQEEQHVYILVKAPAGIWVEKEVRLTAGQGSVQLPEAELAEGISVVTLMDTRRQPLCERLWFKKPKNLLFNIRGSKDNYRLRDHVQLDVSNGDEARPQASFFSASVYKLDSLQAADELSIESYLWLVSELKGYIESPAYYFTKEATDEAAENLMLTQGWRRYKNENALNNIQADAEYLPEYEGHLIAGRIIDNRTGKAAADVLTYLSVPGKNFRFSSSLSDKNGIIRFNVKDYVGHAPVIVQTNTMKDSVYSIDLDHPFSDEQSFLNARPLFVPHAADDILLTRSIHTQVNKIFAVHEEEQKLSQRDTLSIFGAPGKRYNLDDFTRFPTMEEVMREYVAEVAVRKQNGKYFFKVYDETRVNVRDADPLVLVDGVPFFDVDKVLTIDPLKVEKLEVVSNRYLFHYIIAGGVVMYSTYKGNLQDIPLDPAALIVRHPGLEPEKEFYSPRYETAAERASRLPDVRNLLYWSPAQQSKKGSVALDFYTSDQPGQYLVVVQGINEEGIAGSGSYTFEVKE